MFGPPASAPGYAAPPGAPWAGAPDASGFSTTATTIGRPPVVWLVGGLVLSSAAIATALLRGWSADGSIGLAFAAWVAAGPLAIGLLAVHSVRDTQQRARPVYASPTWMPTLYRAVVVLAAVGVVVSAVDIALWAGRQ